MKDINCSLDYSSWVKNSNIPQSKPDGTFKYRTCNLEAPVYFFLAQVSGPAIFGIVEFEHEEFWMRSEQFVDFVRYIREIEVTGFDNILGSVADPWHFGTDPA